MHRNGGEIFTSTRVRSARAPDTAELPRFIDRVLDERPPYRARATAIRRIQWEAVGQIALIAAVIAILVIVAADAVLRP